MPDNGVAHQVIADRYELLDSVGRGGFGVVWRACDTLLQREVAVKEVHLPGFLSDEDRADLRDRVLHEARAAARLDHPGAVTVFDVIDDDGRPVIVMELVDAVDLSQLVAERGPLAPAEVARIGMEVAEVLAAAHARGIVHRDVKPGNVMVGDSGRVRLGDFGVAALRDDPTVSTSAAVTGSPAYMAPEQATNKGARPESDLWSLGATMYFAVEGRPPFDKGAPLPTLASIVKDPPRPPERAGALRPVLEGLLVKDPSARMSAEELRERLADVIAGRAGGDTMVFDLPAEDLTVEEAPAPAPEPEPAPQPQPGPEPVVTAAPAATRTPPPSRVATARPRPVGWLIGLVALVVVALVAVALASRNSDSGTPQTAGPSPSTTATSAGGQGTAATKAPSGGGNTATTAAGRTSSSATSNYTDTQTGFTISYPKDWSVKTDGTLTDFRDPATGAYLRVDHVQPARPSPEGAWFELEQSFAASNDNYSRIRIEPTTYNGFKAAVWEFTYSSGGADLHVADLGFITPKYGFALYFQTRAGDWDRLQSTFQSFKDSFKAPA